MKNNLYAALMILIGVTSCIVADVYLKNSRGIRAPDLAMGTLLYALAAIPVAIAFQTVEFGLLFLLWEALNVLAGLVISHIWYGEPLSSVRVVAAGLALGALLLASH